MTKKELETFIQSSQKLMMDYAVAEAKAKKGKAEVELETAKMHREYAYKLLMQDTKSIIKTQ